MKKVLVVLLMLATAFSIFAKGAEEKKSAVSDSLTVICGSMGNPNTSITGQAGNFFCDTIEEISGGKIKIEMHDQASLGQEAELLQQCMEGLVPFVIIGPSIFSQYTSLFECINLPFLIDDYELEYKAFHTDEFQALVVCNT